MIGFLIGDTHYLHYHQKLFLGRTVQLVSFLSTDSLLIHKLEDSAHQFCSKLFEAMSNQVANFLAGCKLHFVNSLFDIDNFLHSIQDLDVEDMHLYFLIGNRS